jgi:peptidoglycan/xylan/chitin deacetylase (PgdA/CDA1 family)
MRMKLVLAGSLLLPGAFLLHACDSGVPTPLPAEVHVVLTFDDGPFAADVPLQPDDPDLAPLHQILDTLHERNIHAVFYTSVFASGMASDAAAVTLMPSFAAAVIAEHDAGHIVGYHAYDHSPAIWIDSNLTPPLAIALMSADIDRLISYSNDAVRRAGRDPESIFSAVYRQPFGGLEGIFAPEGLFAIAGTGWKYHGYCVDSFDWTDNVLAGAPEILSQPIATQEEHVEYVLHRLRAGAAANADREFVDILLHVNQFTADHLDNWIDELADAFAGQGRSPVIFDVPEGYLTTNDLQVDGGFALPLN